MYRLIWKRSCLIDNMWAYVQDSLKLRWNGTVYDLPSIVITADTAGYKETGIKEIRKAISEGAFAFKDSWQEQNDVSYQWFAENTRAEVLYDTCLKNVIEPEDDEQGRDLHWEVESWKPATKSSNTAATNGDWFLKKTRRNREEVNLTKTRNTTKYLAIKELSDENKTYSISALCEFAGIARSA